MSGQGRPRLFHFSDDPSIEAFEPRPVRVASDRGPGLDWLNGPLVWAVEQERQAVYTFPRDCPRILVWPTESTTLEDRAAWWGQRTCSMIAHIEWTWLERLRTETIYRYELPSDGFEPVPGEDNGWMWVSHVGVRPTRHEAIDGLLDALASMDVELRVMASLVPLRDVWSTTLHASGIRLRNARGWPSS